MDTQKSFEFNGTAGGYFVVFIVTMIGAYIPIFGWPFAFNFAANWIADNAKVNGKNLKYSAGYGETLIFLLLNILLVIVTLGIYTFWFVPKTYRYVADHLSYAGESAPAATAAPKQPTTPVEPAAPKPLVQ